MNRLSTTSEQKMLALQACRYFSALNPTILDELSQGVSLYRYDKKESIFWEDEASKGLYIIKSGTIKLFKISSQGKEIIIKVLEDGDSFNEVPVFDHGTNPVNASTVTESQIWLIRSSVIRNAVEDHPELSNLVIKNLGSNLRMLIGIVEDLSFYQVTNRLARLLLTLPCEDVTGLIQTPLTQQEIAARLGTVREVVSRSLRELESSGAVKVMRRNIYIADFAVLENWAQCP